MTRSTLAIAALLALLAVRPAHAQQLPTPDPQALAESLRSRDPEVREGASLTGYVIRQLLAPRADPSTDAPPEARAVLAGWSRGADRSLMPEFLSARAEQGWSIREHLLDAIYMNASRMGWYSDHAGGLLSRWRSRFLSRYMIVGEAVAILGVSAKRFDTRARAAREQHGVDVLRGDLVPLRPLPVQTPPHFRGVATSAQRKAIRSIVDQLAAALDLALSRGDLRAGADLCHAALVQVVAAEDAWGVHFQMTRHTIGSVGFAMLRGELHARVAPTRALSVEYVKSTIGSTFSYGLNVDRLAQPLHRRGIGFVVNEFTDQAFVDLYRAEVLGLAGRVSASASAP